MNKRHYEHTLPNIRGSLSNTYFESLKIGFFAIFLFRYGSRKKVAGGFLRPALCP